MSSLKAYDSDFVDDQKRQYLTDLAIHIAKGYTGNWDAFLQYKGYCLAGFTLTNAQARQILNMALASTDCRAYWTVIREGLDREPGPITLPANKTITKPKLTVVRDDTNRPFTVDAVTDWKVHWAKSTAWNGVVHRIDAATSYASWRAPWDPADRVNRYAHRYMTLRLGFMCGKTAHHWDGGATYEFFVTEPTDLKMCRRCLEEYGNPKFKRSRYAILNPKYRNRKP